MSRYDKRVNAHGLVWTVVSRNERAITHCGRHFYAGRCRPSSDWTLREMDRDVEMPGRREIGRVANRLATDQLSRAVASICDEVPKGSKPWLCPACYHVNAFDAIKCSCCDRPFATMGPPFIIPMSPHA